MPTDPASPAAVGFAAAGVAQRPQPHVSQVLQFGHCPDAFTLASRESVGPQPEIGAPIPGDREPLNEPKLDQHPGIGADPPLLAASAVASSSEDCRSGSHTSSQPNNRPANRVKLLDSK